MRKQSKFADRKIIILYHFLTFNFFHCFFFNRGTAAKRRVLNIIRNNPGNVKLSLYIQGVYICKTKLHVSQQILTST